MKLAGSVVVVTGASSGIGRATAEAFADRGATVVLTARDADALDDVASACREAGAEVLVAPADVADPEAVERVARQAVSRFGGIDVWVNNAGMHLFAPVDAGPVEQWHRVVETNVFGTYHGVRAALPWMRQRGRGVIINVSSVLGKVGAPEQSAYVASKHAVRALSDCTRQELGDVDGIEVCTVLPGPIDTPLFRHAANHSGKRVTPIKPVIDAHRVAKAIVGAARRPRREVVVGASGTQMLGLGRLAPSLLERAVAKQVEADHFDPEPTPSWDGNLPAPIHEPGEAVSGGWTRRAEQVGGESRRAASNDGSSRLRSVVLVGAAGAAVATVVRTLDGARR